MEPLISAGPASGHRILHPPSLRTFSIPLERWHLPPSSFKPTLQWDTPLTPAAGIARHVLVDACGFEVPIGCLGVHGDGGRVAHPDENGGGEKEGYPVFGSTSWVCRLRGNVGR